MSETITATFEVATRDADQTRALGEDLGRILAAGDLLMLSSTQTPTASRTSATWRPSTWTLPSTRPSPSSSGAKARPRP